MLNSSEHLKSFILRSIVSNILLTWHQLPFKELRIKMMYKASTIVSCHFLFVILSALEQKHNPVAPSADYTVIVVIVADSILTGWLCNVTGMT